MVNPYEHTPTQDEMALIIANASRLTPHLVPILQAARNGRIGFQLMLPGHRADFACLAQARRPCLIIVGDDAGDGRPDGPDVWPDTKRLVRWANRAVVNAAAAKVEHYEAALASALECDRLVLVETSSARALEWEGLFASDGKPTLTIYPTNGQHPCNPPKGSLH